MQVTPSTSSAQSSADKNVPVFPSGQMLAFGLVTLVFFLWGMSNNLTDILVQQFKKSFELSIFQAQLVQTSNFLAYGVMAIPAALLTRRFGYKAGILIGLCTFATGTLLFWPAAVIGTYTPFLIALFFVGGGASILETACNPFMAQFGDPRTSERRLNFAQALNPPGTITGVLVGTWFIFSGVEKNAGEIAEMKTAGTYAAYLHMEIMRVVPTYVGFGCVILLLAFAISRAKFPTHLDAAADEPGEQGSFMALLKYPHFMLAVVAMVFYVGAQIGTWSNLIFYFKSYTDVSEKTAGYLLTVSLVALAAGRFVTTPLMRFFAPAKLIGVYALINMALVFSGIAHPGLFGGYALMATSFFMSVMFPTIFALGVKGLGPNTKIGGSFLVMAIVGGAIFPLLMGAIKERTGSLALGFWVPLAGYAVVGLYSFFVKTPADATVHDVNMSSEAM
jgi:FHS family L-fucose permease-like MFS transporter